VKLYLASKNAHKLEELQEILGSDCWQVELCTNLSSQISWVESGTTFEENATIKALAVRQLTDEAVLSDDSGLVVECLSGEPGVYSSRYAGEDATDAENTQKLIREVKKFDGPYKAYFVCMLCFLEKGSSEPILIEGRCEGSIEPVLKGDGGFGYDPVFIPNGYEKTFAELHEDIKNKISHRANALSKFKSMDFHL
jgi:XTP/dITP diphosphohydrolase